MITDLKFFDNSIGLVLLIQDFSISSRSTIITGQFVNLKAKFV